MTKYNIYFVSLLPPDEPVSVDVTDSGKVDISTGGHVEAALFLQDILNKIR